MVFHNFSDNDVPIFPGDLVQIAWSLAGPPPDMGIVTKQHTGMVIFYELNEFGNDIFKLWTARGMQTFSMPGPILRVRGKEWAWSLKKLS